MSKVKIDGFRMHQGILKEFHFMRDQSFERPPASAYVVYLTMLKQIDEEKNPRGMLKEYNLAYWSKILNIPYSSLYSGKRYLEKHKFVSEEIHNDLPVLVLKDVEKYNNPGSVESGKLNYLLIPHALFNTNILAEMVRTSNPEGIELILSLLNQFRTSMSKKDSFELHKLRQARNMATLKKQLNKNAKKTREILSLLGPLFNIEYEGVELRGKQIWVRKVWITLREECVKEQNAEEFEIAHLTASLSHELSYFLDGQKLNYKPRDLIDIMFSFKQEVYNILSPLKNKEEFKVNSFIKDYFIYCIDEIGTYIHKQRKEQKTFRIHSLGGLFRMVFRNNLSSQLHKLPYELIHEIKVDHFLRTGDLPKFAKFHI
ncbi:hypothetical protein D1B31_18110 [Neobacillus notoginsengisoli]|uniref:Uncharacterized protein n=1 Tax=Neobacillus notoginsengisoli TaxID=1578198 RepID=A0A417YQD9_9BACI|nr:hypothetical protein [Neobacillus notoginsengisoli]RHW36003.1 hypothetical protein D1B31_18110 [Neobacillus notoginsengisoli]